MDQKEQIDRFAGDLDKLVGLYKREYDLSYASVIGCLDMKITLLTLEAIKVAREQDENQD